LLLIFSALGLDVSPAQGPNEVLFGHLLIKSRAAEAFNSPPKDFSGPFTIGSKNK